MSTTVGKLICTLRRRYLRVDIIFIRLITLYALPSAVWTEIYILTPVNWIRWVEKNIKKNKNKKKTLLFHFHLFYRSFRIILWSVWCLFYGRIKINAIVFPFCLSNACRDVFTRRVVSKQRERNIMCWKWFRIYCPGIEFYNKYI